MNINFLEDLNIPEEWPMEGPGDWLHPENGPLPDHLSLLQYGNYYFMAAIWEMRRSLIVMTERLDQEDPDPAVPLRNIDEVYTTRGWIAQTHRWEISPDGIKRDQRIIIPDRCKYQFSWREYIYRTVITETLKMMCIESHTI